MSGFLLDTYPSGATIYGLFHTFNSSGASVTITGLAVTDIEIYKNGSTTQRSSDNGYTLLDTDGIDVDSITGLQGISIDLSDNTDAGFYAVGSQYTVVISSITADSQTVSFILGSFRIMAAENTAGYPVATIKDGTGTGEIDTTSGGVLVAAFAANSITAAAIADGAIDAATFAASAITSTVIAADAITAAKVAADVSQEIRAEMDSNSTKLASIDSKTINLPSDPADESLILAAIAGVSAGSGVNLSDVVEGSLTLGDVLRIMLSAMSGASTATAGVRTYLSVDGNTVRIEATVSNGDRSEITLDGSA